MRIVAVGGGHGLARSLQALTHLPAQITALVTVADDGGSSGRLRRDLDVVPPGDLRMALAALADDPQIAALLQYRFSAGDLEGHALGNLLIVAMSDLSRGLVPALDRLGQALGCRGRVLPCTTTPLVLRGEGPDGPLDGQVAVATQGPAQRLWLDPADPPACEEAVAAIAQADAIVLGPGSIFTSILPNLLVPGIAEAVINSPAPTVLIANMREQRGEADGLTLREHVDALVQHVPGLQLDVVLAHEGARPSGLGSPLSAASLDGHQSVGRVVTADLLDGKDGHDPRRLADSLGHLLETSRTA